MSVEVRLHFGRPLTSQNDENFEKIPQKINEYRRFTIVLILEETGVSWNSCQGILTEDLQMLPINLFLTFSLRIKKKNIFLKLGFEQLGFENDPDFFLETKTFVKI